MDLITLALAKKQIGKGTAQAVSDYLDEHLTNPTNPPIDTSLTIAGAAADSKETGDKISALKEELKKKADKGISPIFVYPFPLFYPSGKEQIANFNATDALIAEKFFTVSGTANSEILTIDNDSILTASDLTANDPHRGALVNNGVYTVVSIMKNSNGDVTIYPTPTENFSGATLWSLGASIHLSKQGYIAYAQYAYNSVAKYTDKSKYLAKFDAFNYDNVTNPFTKIGNYWWGKGYKNTVSNTQRLSDNSTITHFNMVVNNAGSASNAVGGEWEVTLDGKTGYVEIFAGLYDGVDLGANLANGLAARFELYLDGELSQTYTKSTKEIEAIRLDFANAKKGKLRIVTNSGATTFSIRISAVYWWVSDKSKTEKAIDPYGSIVMFMDSWGVYCENAVKTELVALMTADANGMASPLINKSVGGKTSAWGCENFTTDVWDNHPKYMVTNFGINDYTTGVAQAQYITNMENLINAATANGITPVVILAGYDTTGGRYSERSLPLLSAYAKDASAE